MFEINPFAGLEAIISVGAMQAYLVAMVIFVVGGTILDMLHKKSAQYFFENSKKAQERATRQVGSGEKVSLAIKTVANEVLTSAEFSNTKRRLSHLLTMYGFIIFVASTVALIFAFTGEGAAKMPSIVPVLWHVGAIMLCVGGYWFWFAIRVDLAAEGNPWYRVIRADMFILSLLGTCTFALIWSAMQGTTTGWIAFGLFIFSSTILFAGVLWSKFAHMFFKPAAAFQKRVTQADGSRENLPELADRSNPADRDRHSMELLKDAPEDMGLGIKREAPHHY